MNKINKNKKIFKLLCVALAICSILVLIIGKKMGFFLFGIMLMISILLLSLFYSFKIKKPFKELVIPEILKEYKPSLIYIPKLNVKEQYIYLIKESKLIPSATSFAINDGIVDEINNYNVTSFDLHATHTQSTGKTTTTVTDFKGRFYDIEFDKLPCDFIIKEEILKRIPEGYSYLELEHIEFNKAFNIYVKDTHEAFKVFTPSVIKKYYELAALDEFKTIVHFTNNHLYIYIYNNVNLFEDTSENYKEKIIADYEKQYKDILQYFNVFEYYDLY